MDAVPSLKLFAVKTRPTVAHTGIHVALVHQTGVTIKTLASLFFQSLCHFMLVIHVAMVAWCVGKMTPVVSIQITPGDVVQHLTLFVVKMVIIVVQKTTLVIKLIVHARKIQGQKQ